MARGIFLRPVENLLKNVRPFVNKNWGISIYVYETDLLAYII